MMQFVGPRGEVWITLGGGLHRGEAPVAGLRRELHEETSIDGWRIGPEVWTRSVTFELHGEQVAQHERYFLVPTAKFDPPEDMPDEVERQFFGGFRWWRIEEIAASDQRFAPRRLADRLQELVLGGPPESPIDVGR